MTKRLKPLDERLLDQMKEDTDDTGEEADPIGDRPLTLKQEAFCKLYAADKECFGNGTRAYMQAYNCSHAVANSTSSRLLWNVSICQRINEYLTLDGWNDAFMDKQTLFVASQHKDLPSKNRAIEQYNKIRNRITENHKHTGDITGLRELSTEELMALLEKVNKDKEDSKKE